MKSLRVTQAPVLEVCFASEWQNTNKRDLWLKYHWYPGSCVCIMPTHSFLSLPIEKKKESLFVFSDSVKPFPL